jgi:hypothetical protein
MAIALFAAPLAWAVQVGASYSLASLHCGNAQAARLATLIGVDAVTLAVALVGVFAAYRIWRATRHELEDSAGHPVDTGEGRTRFLSLFGLIAGIGFAIAIAFLSIPSFVVPPCVR